MHSYHRCPCCKAQQQESTMLSESRVEMKSSKIRLYPKVSEGAPKDLKGMPRSHRFFGVRRGYNPPKVREQDTRATFDDLNSLALSMRTLVRPLSLTLSSMVGWSLTAPSSGYCQSLRLPGAASEMRGDPPVEGDQIHIVAECVQRASSDAKSKFR